MSCWKCVVVDFYFSSRWRHTRCALVSGGQTCALPICIGEAVSMKLAARGANVVINYRASAEEADRTAARCLAFGVRAIAAKGDVGEVQDGRSLAQVALDLGGTIDMLVNNAGAPKFAAHSDLDALSADALLSIYRPILVEIGRAHV